MSEEKFMLEAIRLSRESITKTKGGPFGAVIVKDGKIIAGEFNKVASGNDPTAHAEIEAIRAACKILNTFNLEDCEIYTSCEPCPMCLSAIYWSRIKKIYYANTRHHAAELNFSDAFIYDEIQKPIEERTIPMIQILHIEAKSVFDEWLDKEDKVHY